MVVFFTTLLGALCCSVILAGPAYAYLDPGTGSMLVQMLIAGVLGALFTIKMWLGSAKQLVRRVMGGKKAVEAPAVAKDAE